jgi:hypothetical protein
MLVELKKKKGDDFKAESWTDGEEVFNWWIEEGKRNVRGQLTFDFNGDIKEE